MTKHKPHRDATTEAGYYCSVRSSVIGQSFKTRTRIWAAALVGLATISADLLLAHLDSAALFLRFQPAIVAMAALFALAHRDYRSLGLRLHPAQGWRYWLVPSTIAGVGIVTISLIYLALVPSEWSLVASKGRQLSDSRLWSFFVHACVQTPPVEEALYRVVLCVSLVSIVGRIPTILLSGLVFAALHFIYNNPGPDNAVAGFILGWAYLKSETVTVPILMHAFGNLVVIAVHIAAALAQ
jgi:membrane protease YdiL (CAAX protease family)